MTRDQSSKLCASTVHAQSLDQTKRALPRLMFRSSFETCPESSPCNRGSPKPSTPAWSEVHAGQYSRQARQHGQIRQLRSNGRTWHAEEGPDPLQQAKGPNLSQSTSHTNISCTSNSSLTLLLPSVAIFINLMFEVNFGHIIEYSYSLNDLIN